MCRPEVPESSVKGVNMPYPNWLSCVLLPGGCQRPMLGRPVLSSAGPSGQDPRGRKRTHIT